MSKNQSNSKYLNSIKEKETENKEKIKVDAYIRRTSGISIKEA